MSDRPTTITAGQVASPEHGLPDGATGVRWKNGWTECRGHLLHPSWRQAVDRADLAEVGRVIYAPIRCDLCADLAVHLDGQ